MSVFSRFGNYLSGLGNSISSAFSNVTNTIKGAIGGAGSQTASVGNAVKTSSTGTVAPSSSPSMVVPQVYYGSTGSGSSQNVPAGNYGLATIPAGSYYANPTSPVPMGPQLPVTISAGAQRMATSTPENNLLSVAPTTQSKSISSANLFGTTMNNEVGGVSPVGVINSKPTASNVNGIDNTKLVGLMSGYYKFNPQSQQFEPVTETATETDQQTAKKTKDLYDSILGPKQDVNTDPEVVQARNNRQRIQQALQSPTSELNAIIAKQNQDLLQLRQTGAQEGVTEAVYGGQSNTINYNAAIRALPLQAHIASLQGELKLAQDFLTELVQIKTEQINNQYDYNKTLFTAIKDVISKKDQRAYDEITKANDRAYETEKDFIKVQSTLLQNAYTNGAPTSVINAIASAKDSRNAVASAGQYGVAPNTQVTQLDNGETVVVDKGTGRIVANVGGRKTGASYNVTGLTPEQAADPFIQKMAATAGGKPITDAFAQKLNKGLTVLDQIGVLQTNIKDVKTGPIVGAFRGANPWDTNAQTIKAQLNAIVPNLARGVFGEVGVLTDNDIAQYSKTLPNLQSTEDIRNAVLGITVDLIGKSIKSTLEVNAANQKDVSGFIDIYTNMLATRDSVFSQIPGYKGAGAKTETPVTPEVQALRSKWQY